MNNNSSKRDSLRRDLSLQRRTAMALERRDQSLGKLNFEEDDTVRTDTDLTESVFSPSYASFSLHSSSHGSFRTMDSFHNSQGSLSTRDQEEDQASTCVPGDKSGVVQRMARAQRRRSDFISSLIEPSNVQRQGQRAKLQAPDDQPDGCPTPPILKQSSQDTKNTPRQKKKKIPLHQERLQQSKQRMLTINQSLQGEVSRGELAIVGTNSTSDHPFATMEMVEKGIPITISWESPETMGEPSQQQRRGRGGLVRRRRSSSLPPMGKEGDGPGEQPSPDSPKKTRRGRKKNKGEEKVSKSKRGRSQSKKKRKGSRQSSSVPPPPLPPQEAPGTPFSKAKKAPSEKRSRKQQERKKKQVETRPQSISRGDKSRSNQPSSERSKAKSSNKKEQDKKVTAKTKPDCTKNQQQQQQEQEQYEELMAFAVQCRQSREQLEATSLLNQSRTASAATSLQNIPLEERQALRQERYQRAMDRAKVYTKSNSLW